MRPLLLVLLLVLSIAPRLEAAVGDTAPAWQATTAAGVPVSIGEEVRRQPVVLFFWASWCPYCKALMPHLQSMQLEYGDRARILAINFRDDEDPVAYMQKAGYEFTVISDGDKIADLHGIYGTPGLLIIDRERTIRFDLYSVPRNAPAEGEEGESHQRKAARRAPYWAAEIRKSLDTVLAGTEQHN